MSTEVNIQSYFQTGDSSWAQAFQRAANAGISVFIPQGNYTIDQSVTFGVSNMRLRGLGQGARILIVTNNQNTFVIQSGVINFAIENVKFTTQLSSPMTGGTVIGATNSDRLQFRDVYIGSYEDYASQGNKPYLWQGVALSNCSDVVWSSGAIIGCQQSGMFAFSNSNSSASTSIDGQTEIAYNSPGILIDGGVGGFSIGDANIQFNSTGVLINNDAGINREVFLGYDCYLDTNSGGGLVINPGSLVYLEASGTWFAGNNVNIQIAANQPAGACFKFTGSRIYSAVTDGFQFSGGQLILTGCAVELNGKGSSGGQGLTINNASVPPPLINDNFFRANGLGLTGYGVGMIAGVSNYMLSGNVFQGNKSGAISASNQGTRGANLML